jgi:hypothetical protein
MTEIQLLMFYLHSMQHALLDGRERDERGVTAETVILTAIFAAGAIVIGTIIIAKFTSKANSIPTGP